MARRRRQQGSFSRSLAVVIALAAMGYLIYALVSNFSSQTAVIESGNMGNQYNAEAVIVRNESLTDAEGLSSVKYYADEGELIYKGGKIAEVYSSGYSQTDINKLLSTRSEIKSQVKAALASVQADAELNRLDGQVLDYARELSMLVQDREQGNLLNLERQLSTALSNRQSYLRDKFYNSQPTLAGLYDTETTLVKKIQSWTTTYVATQDCIVSFYTDDYENVLTADGFDEIGISLVKGVLAGDEAPQTTAQRGRTAIFREVNPTGWYLLLISHDKNWNPVTGQYYKVQLGGFDNLVVDGEVTSFTRSGNELLVRMQVNADVEQVLNVRTVKAEVSEQYFSGLKVPLNALRQQGDQIGVVLTDGGGLFVPVTIVMRDNSYAVVQPVMAGILSEGQKIRLF